MELRSRNLRVPTWMVVERANEQSHESVVEFKATCSRGWLYRFMKWKGLSLRQRTTVCQSTPADCLPKLVSFIIHLHKLRKIHTFSQEFGSRDGWDSLLVQYAVRNHSCFYWLKIYSTKTTRHERTTSPLSARADGKKLKLFIVFKGKGTHLLKELEKNPGVIVQFSGNEWMSNNDITSDYQEVR